MSIERSQAALTGMEVMDNVKRVTKDAAATLTVYEQVVFADTTDGAMAITLPPVSEAVGKMYSIKLITDGGNLTVQDQDDSYDWSGQGGDFTLTAATDCVLLFSDGHAWYNLCEQTT